MSFRQTQSIANVFSGTITEHSIVNMGMCVIFKMNIVTIVLC